MSVLNKLTEGIVNRNLSKEGAALRSKWERTGLLEGLDDERNRDSMSCLLENQAKELLREASQMNAGDVEGFAAVAFPIVRRVFGGLIANDLVSVQPMSLPSGLIFFLDFQASTHSPRLGTEKDDSLFGGGVVGQQLTGGVSLTDESGEDGFYNLNNGYSSPTSSLSDIEWKVNGSLVFSGGVGHVEGDGLRASGAGTADSGFSSDGHADQEYAKIGNRILRFDPDLVSGAVGSSAASRVCVARLKKSVFQTAGTKLNEDNLVAIQLGLEVGRTHAGGPTPNDPVGFQVRRLTQVDPLDSDYLLFVVASTGSETSAQLSAALLATTGVMYPQTDNFAGTPAAGSNAALGAVAGAATWGLENNEQIPEIDIKVDSVSVTAVTKKLKAKWTPELGQDLNAYHNLDAEVELTSILSEQIALEIDREILEDLIKGSKAGTLYWSRQPGNFVNRETGASLEVATASSGYPEFTGTVSEWYETLVETVNDVSARIHRKTLRGGANFLVVSPEVANLLEFTSGFRANITHDDDKGSVGAVNVGSLSKKWDVWVDPYFPRNVILIGRKGNSFLESGYVYAPYVPLQVTPTIFGPEDFVPRKGVMTRYAKKMVRPDMYGLVVVRDLV